MTDDRTDAQRKADDALDDAIRKVMDVYGMAQGDDGEPGVVVQWITLVLSVGQDQNGGWSSTSTLMPYGDGTTPWAQVFGMLRCAQLRLENSYMTPDGPRE